MNISLFLTSASEVLKMNEFEKFNLDEGFIMTLNHLGFKKPTEIQNKSIKHILEGKDIIGESATGSGKTLAFSVGIIEIVEKGKGVQAIVLSPTRELAEQIRKDLVSYSAHKDLNIISVYGGVSIDRQIYDLQSADVVVATPGRMLDIINRRAIRLQEVKVLVIDEADRMLDMGFIEDVEKIVSYCPKQRQTMFFTATVTQRLMQLANNYMNNAVKVSANRHVDPSKLKQVYFNVSRNLKLSLLVHLLKQKKQGLTMVFCNTRRSTDFVIKNLKANKIKAIAIHGGFTQNKREKAIEQFNKMKDCTLVCTDVAARGLHIKDVEHVINYEIPTDAKDYVHRIGRTARAGNSGKVFNLIAEQDHENFSKVEYEYSEFNIEMQKRPYIEMIKPLYVQPRRRFRR
ncbi:DEAD/DEAH box helicase [Candidatus Woesearchaeota archaeon]|nr:MAG: DEAD/DEAH box helicase [Candidatus Woesearchaeota archaeon]